MMLRNAFRLILANFSLVWKNLLWIVILSCFTFGIGYAICSPIISAVVDAGILDGFSAYFSASSSNSFQYSFAYLVSVTQSIFALIFSNFSTLALPFILGIIFLIFVFGIANSVRNLATCEVARGSMTSQTRLKFTGALISKTGVGALMGLMKTILFLPFLAFSIFIFYLGNLMIQAGGIAYQFAPFVVILLFTISIAVHQSIFCCWSPVVVMQKTAVVKSLKQSFQAVFSRFWRTLSNSFVLVLLIIIINYSCAKFSFCVSLILTIPTSMVLVCMYEMVTYFTALGQTYYIDSQTISISPKIEFNDKPQKNKYLI